LAESSIRGSRSAAPWLFAGAGYSALALLFTWPLALRPQRVLPHDLGDPLFAVWILWWNAHVVPLTEGWWNAPFFWPQAGALGLSEHLLGLSLLATPLQWLGVDPVAAYNVIFLLSFPLSALAMHALAFTLVRRHDAAALAGLLFGFSPYRTAQMAHIQMLWTFWMPIALLALHQYARDARRRWLALFGAMWTGQALSNGYYLFFFPVLVVCWVAWFLVSRRDLQRALRIGVAAAAASIPLLPILIGYRRIHTRLSLERSIGEIREFSADVMALVTTAPALWAWTPLSEARGPEQELFPGVVAPALILAAGGAALWTTRGGAAPYPRVRKALAAAAALLALVAVTPALVGPWQLSAAGVTLLSVATPSKPLTIAIWCALGVLVTGWRFQHAVATRSMFAFYVSATVLMYVCSFGPEPSFDGFVFWYKPPYSWLMALPGYSSVRVPSRFALLGTLCLAAAAALALARLTRALPPRPAFAAGLACCGLALADLWVSSVPLPAIPARIRSLEEARGTSAVVELPLGDTEPDLAAMYRSIYHRMPVVNGYGGYFPAPYAALRAALRDGEIAALSALDGPLTVVVDPASDSRQLTPLAPDLESATVDPETGRRMLTLPAQPDDTVETPGSSLAVRSVSASSAIDLVPLTDGNPHSRWESGGAQRGDEWVMFELDAPRRVNGLVLALGPLPDCYPRVLRIEVSLDGRTWAQVFEGPSGAAAVRAARRDPRHVAVTYGFAAVQARWIRAQQTGSTGTLPWSISEASVLGR
jgi:hypothetical protein